MTTTYKVGDLANLLAKEAAKLTKKKLDKKQHQKTSNETVTVSDDVNKVDSLLSDDDNRVTSDDDSRLTSDDDVNDDDILSSDNDDDMLSSDNDDEIPSSDNDDSPTPVDIRLSTTKGNHNDGQKDNMEAVNGGEMKKTKDDQANNKRRLIDSNELAAINKRTVFVGNVGVLTKKTALLRLFKRYGEVETVRIRSVPVNNLRMSRKVAAITREFHPHCKCLNAYVRFANEQSAKKAVAEANGLEYKGHHLRVNMADDGRKFDANKAIFVGNLKFDTQEDELWRTFEICGAISSVRLVRDGKTNVGKGFGYVNFHATDGVTLALQMENVQLKGRELRISACRSDDKKKNNKKRKANGTNKKNKKSKVMSAKEGYTRRTLNDSEKKAVGMADFAGSKFSDKKKKKNSNNKGLLQKKRLAKQLSS